jgi:hypothetical protein
MMVVQSNRTLGIGSNVPGPDGGTWPVKSGLVMT